MHDFVILRHTKSLHHLHRNAGIRSMHFYQSKMPTSAQMIHIRFCAAKRLYKKTVVFSRVSSKKKPNKKQYKTYGYMIISMRQQYEICAFPSAKSYLEISAFTPGRQCLPLRLDPNSATRQSFRTCKIFAVNNLNTRQNM